MLKKLIIGGGGSAGHVLPSLRIADFVKDYYSDIIFIGGKNSIEESICKEMGVKFISIETAKFDRTNKIKLPLAAIKNLAGIFQALILLLRLKPDAIFVSGGYASVPLVVAGRIVGVKRIVLHVCDLTMGLAHKLCAPFATHITSTFSKTVESLDKGKFVGPISPFVNKSISNIVKSENNKPCLLVYGGSLGSQVINLKLRKSLDEILPKFNIIHVCGKGNLDSTVTAAGYTQFEFVHNFQQLLLKADFSITRGGSNSLWELILAKIPHIAVPLPLSVSRGDQIENCKYFASLGVSRYLEQGHFVISDLAAELENLVSSAIEIKQNMDLITPKKQATIVVKEILLNNLEVK
ncbi:MAG TPA: glycosyltransferase [Saprospiraceae bacterium]|nr:glycosyltransferase [Saprospiraceae bacterium]